MEFLKTYLNGEIEALPNLFCPLNNLVERIAFKINHNLNIRDDLIEFAETNQPWSIFDNICFPEETQLIIISDPNISNLKSKNIYQFLLWSLIVSNKVSKEFLYHYKFIDDPLNCVINDLTRTIARCWSSDQKYKSLYQIELNKIQNIIEIIIELIKAKNTRYELFITDYQIKLIDVTYDKFRQVLPPFDENYANTAFANLTNKVTWLDNVIYLTGHFDRFRGKMRKKIYTKMKYSMTWQELFMVLRCCSNQIFLNLAMSKLNMKHLFSQYNTFGIKYSLEFILTWQKLCSEHVNIPNIIGTFAFFSCDKEYLKTLLPSDDGTTIVGFLHNYLAQ